MAKPSHPTEIGTDDENDEDANEDGSRQVWTPERNQERRSIQLIRRNDQIFDFLRVSSM